MNDTNDHDRSGDDTGRCRHGVSRRTRIGIAAAGLLAAGAALGGLATLSATAGAHAFGGRHGLDAEELAERARDRVSWMLARVDATAEQEQQVGGIVDALVAQIEPLRAEHRENRRDLVAGLMSEPLEPVRLEAIRQQELRLADIASARLLDAVVQTAEVLTPQQREALLERMARHHR